MKSGLRTTTLDKLNFILSALLDMDKFHEKGMAFSEMTDKSLASFKSKLLHEKTILNLAIVSYCSKKDIDWTPKYSLYSICKTSRQINWLANELKHYITHHVNAYSRPTTYQIEFDFDCI